MVIKTELCSYTEYKAYPGCGQRFVAKDGRVSFFLTKKADSLFHQKIKAVKLTWSQAWRRMNKKGKLEANARRKKGKQTKITKAIVGMSLEDMKAKRAGKTTLRAQAKEEAAKEARARAQKRSSTKPAQQSGKNAPQQKKQQHTKSAPAKNAKNFQQRK